MLAADEQQIFLDVRAKEEKQSELLPHQSESAPTSLWVWLITGYFVEPIPEMACGFSLQFSTWRFRFPTYRQRVLKVFPLALYYGHFFMILVHIVVQKSYQKPQFTQFINLIISHHAFLFQKISPAVISITLCARISHSLKFLSQ